MVPLKYKTSGKYYQSIYFNEKSETRNVMEEIKRKIVLSSFWVLPNEDIAGYE